MSFDLFDFTKHSSKINNKRTSDLEIEVELPGEYVDNDDDDLEKQVYDTWSYLIENKEVVLENKELCESLLNNKPKLVDIWFKDQVVDDETTILASFLVDSIFYYVFLHKLLSYS